ncbi:hypothetical protein ACEPAG_3868 [Sanghuangporus baumii]
MADGNCNALDRLGFLDDELAKVRELRILGEAGSGVNDGRKDEQAEKIEGIIREAKTVLAQLKTRNESKLSYPWYSFQSILAVALAPMSADLERQADALVSSATNIARATAQFRKRYEFIYRAALYALLPEQIVPDDSSLWDNDINAGFLMTANSLCFTFQACGAVSISSTLDDEHLLNRSLVSLSVRMAAILEMTRKQREHIDVHAKELAERAGDLFQNILVTSQSDSLSRAAVSLFLEDVTRMIGILEVYISDGISTEISFVASIDREWREQQACGWEGIFSRQKTHESVLVPINRMRHWDTRISRRNELTATEVQRSGLLVKNMSQNDLTFAIVAKRMEENCIVERFHGTIVKQNFESGVKRREGSYADVRRVRLNEQRNLWNMWCFNEVAVKVIRKTGPEHVIAKRVFREFIIWSQMRHPNIVPLIGLWFDFGCETGLPAFVSPWLEHGSLLRYLRERPDMDRAQRLHLLLGVAKALAYMHNHQPCVCHGDINPDNILVSNGDAFVCDFGISHISAPCRGLTTDPHGGWRYRAPEQLKGEPTPTPQSDMYSFGLLCYFVLTGHVPWNEIMEADRISNPDVIMRRPDSMLSVDCELLEYCWMRDPRLRATATIAVGKLDVLVK